MSQTNPNPKENRPMHAYIVMLHLVSQKHSTFKEIKELLSFEVKRGFPQAKIMNVLGYIFERIKDLSDEWDEFIPIINALVFVDKGLCTSYICEKVFELTEKGQQPTTQQIAKYAVSVTAYPRWNDVLEVFRKEAFDQTQNQ